MKITNGGETRGVRAGGAKRQPSAASKSGFSSHLDGPTAQAATEAASGPASIAALLAVQATGDALEGRKQAYDRAEGLLKRLESIRVALLEGRLDDAALRRLAEDLKREAGAVADPIMAETIAEIELRAAVEPAKRHLI